MSMVSVLLAVAFQVAQPVWPEGMANESNVQVRFSAELKEARGAVLRVTGADAYRIELDGKFVGYGPARGPKGWFRIDEWPLKGSGKVEIVAQGNNCCNYYFAENRPFLQAEVVCDGKVVAATAAKGGGFVAELTERVRKVPRYSFQRAYAEAYRVGAKGALVPLEVCPPVKYLERIAPYPSFAVNDRIRVLSTADVGFGVRRHHDAKFDEMVGEVEVNNWDDLLRLRFANRDETARLESVPYRVKDGKSLRLDAGLNDCGFYGMTVEVKKPGRLILDFDEVLTDGEVNSSRMCCCNAVEWLFENPGRYEVETFEPYVWRYANLSAFGGEFDVADLHVRGYKSGQVGRAKFSCSDPALEKIFAAAVETYAQNAVDVFTDCPSRERAGWLCDSFFIGRVNKLLCGETEMERLFLQNYVLPEKFDYLPDAALPMCYPSAHPNGNFIPNWVMWLIFEAEEYLARSGDRATVDALRPKFEAYVKYLSTFRNSDGLLEKLPKWVFVEWSRANRLVQDVNYPSNMAWAEVLDVMDRLYGKPELAAEAKRIRETVRKQSWTGKWFCDNAVRQADGTLKLSGECTETCQYYAFFFGTATPETHPDLWKTMVDDFGPKRFDPNDRTKLLKHPEIWPSNAFIGNYLRLELLSRAGLVKNILDETKEFFLYMADRTGTLWEYDRTTASCCHGFASHAAVYLVRDVLGVKSIDVANRKAVAEPPSGLDLDWCEGTIPVSAAESVTVKWSRGGKANAVWRESLRW